jgi:hypothetical protein
MLYRYNKSSMFIALVFGAVILLVLLTSIGYPLVEYCISK